MATTQIITCKCGCKRKKEVRTADVKRGWGLFFSKSCKAKWQSRTKGNTRSKGNWNKERRESQENYNGNAFQVNCSGKSFNDMSADEFNDFIHDEAMDAQGFNDFLECGDR